VRKLLISIFLASSAVSFAGTIASAFEIKKASGVVEVFTSQGCYSCPPADKIVGDFAKTNNVLALSWHVDYWDYLGWKDSLASKENTKRQYHYAQTLGERQVYTPQAIINGRMHTVGSNLKKINTALSRFESSNQGMTVPIEANVNNASLKIEVEYSKEADNATLYMVFFNKRHDVKIKRGENGGKTLSYHNVVHKSQALGMVKEDGFSMEYPIAEMKNQGYDGSALILQQSDPAGGPSTILGATVITGL
jgi:hypothetical protein